MHKALLTFSDGSTLQVKENQHLTPVVSYSKDDHFEVSLDNSFEIWYHIHDGLIPGLCEFLVNSSFFYLEDDRTTIYKSDSVIKIQNL